MNARTEVIERSDPRESLDAFAKSEPRDVSSLPSVRELSGAAERIIGAQQVAVYRDEGRILGKLKALAAAAGTDWYYRFPVKNKRAGTTDWIEGPSIKLANDLARTYGNCEVDIRVLDLGDSWLFYARFTDFETGFSLTRPFQQYKEASKLGGSDDARRKDIAMQIGASKAIRNVVVNALQTFADFAFEEAKDAIVEKIGRDLDGWRAKITDRLKQQGVDVKRVEMAIGRIAADWVAPDMARIIAMMKAVNDGMATLDETFPPAAAGETKAEQQPASAKLDKFAKKDAPHAEEQQPETQAEPEKDPRAKAYEEGEAACDAGLKIGAVPGEYRDSKELSSAWQDGHRARTEARKNGNAASLLD